MRGGSLALRRGIALPSPSPWLGRRLLVALAVALALAAGYYFWLRDSQLVAVDEVTITGLSTKDAERVRGTLRVAASSMTTLHVDHERLERAVAAFPVVRSLEVSADFPHGLVIHVVEHHPAAIAEVGAQRLPVASDGTLLRGLPVEGRLPALDAKAGVRGERLAGRAALGAAHVAGTAPRALLGRLERVETRADDGIVVTMREGPELIFGDATRARAKWIAAARVLADPQAAGATYLDLRLPGRPAAGGLPAETLAPVAPAGITPADPAAGVTGAAPAGPALSGAPTTVTDPALTAPAGEPTTASPPAAETPGEPPTLDDGTGAGAVAAPTG